VGRDSSPPLTYCLWYSHICAEKGHKLQLTNSNRKHNVMVWCPSVCPSVPLAYSPRLTTGQHVMRPAYVYFVWQWVGLTKLLFYAVWKGKKLTLPAWWLTEQFLMVDGHDYSTLTHHYTRPPSACCVNECLVHWLRDLRNDSLSSSL